MHRLVTWLGLRWCRETVDTTASPLHPPNMTLTVLREGTAASPQWSSSFEIRASWSFIGINTLSHTAACYICESEDAEWMCVCLCADPFAFINPTQCVLCEWMCACSWINPFRAAGTVSKPGHHEMVHELSCTIWVSSRFWSVLPRVILCDGSAALYSSVLQFQYSLLL